MTENNKDILEDAKRYMESNLLPQSKPIGRQVITGLIQEVEKLREEQSNLRATNEMFMRCDFVGCDNTATGGTPQKNGLYESTCKEHHHLAEEGQYDTIPNLKAENKEIKRDLELAKADYKRIWDGEW